MAFSANANKDCVLAWEAMPDALQDALTQQQDAWLQAHLAGCAPCRAQFAQQRRLQRALSLPVAPAMDAEAGLQRLFARIDTPAIVEAQDSVRAGGWMGRALVAAVLVQAIGLGAMGAKLWSQSPQSPEYRTLAREAAPAPAGAIRVVPDPAMSLAEWDALLQAEKLQVVAGPNGVGAYTVAPRAGAGAGGSDALLSRLRATRGVRLAEPVADAP
jgi:hypothetical protein